MIGSAGRGKGRQHFAWEQTRDHSHLPTDRSFNTRCMRNFFIAVDRSHDQFTNKAISKAMTQLTIITDSTLQKLAKYCLTKPIAVASAIVGLSDANLAACAVTQKSVNLHTFDAISQSSRKDEFHGVVRGACRTLGLTSLILDLGFSVQAKLRTNKTAAKKTGTTTRSWTSATHPLFRTVVATINRTTEKSNRETNCIDTFN